MTKKTTTIITNLPTTLHGAGFFFKMLKRQLPNGLLGARLLDRGGIGIAIFASVEAALSACRESVYFTDNVNGERCLAHFRIVDFEDDPHSVKSLESDTINVEGESIILSDLAPTVGLQLHFRGVKSAQWCRHTKNEENCPIGKSCRFIHRKNSQHSVKRQRQDYSLVPPSRDAGIHHYQWFPSGILNSADIVSILPPFLEISLANYDITGGKLDDLVSKVKSFSTRNNQCSIFFKVRVGDRDFSLTSFFTDSAAGLQKLRHSGCCLPKNGAPTPIERDLFIAEILRSRNKCLGEIGLRPEDYLRTLFSLRELQQTDISNATLFAFPCYCIPTVFHEYSFFVRDGAVICVTQRESNVLGPTDALSLSKNESDLEDHLNKKCLAVRRIIESWQSIEKVTACFVIAFPAHTFCASGSQVEKPAHVSFLNSSVSQEVVNHVFGEPVIVAVKDFATEVEKNTLYGSATSSKPLWRRQRTSAKPLFSREIVDSFSSSETQQ